MEARLGKLLLIGASLGCLSPALSIAACLSHKSPFAASSDQQDATQRMKASLAATGSFLRLLLFVIGTISGRNFSQQDGVVRGKTELRDTTA